MYKNKKISVVVPAHNEEKLIEQVLSTMPDWVDLIIVVDDCSEDKTVEIVQAWNETSSKVLLIQHSENGGVGAAIATGYQASLEKGFDVTAVMAGDAQMDPKELEKIVQPVAEQGIGYVKGNRLFSGEAWDIIPKYRYIGNAILSLLTKIASGYWHVADSQCGYTAISKEALQAIHIDKIFKRYGMPNDLLVKLNIAEQSVRDVAIRPIYNIGEVSGIRLRREVVKISQLLISCFFQRLLQKIRDTRFSSPRLFLFFRLGGISFRGFNRGLYIFIANHGGPSLCHQRLVCHSSDNLWITISSFCHVV